jgi:hypothetical protein
MLNRWLRIGAFFLAGAAPQLQSMPLAAAAPYSAGEMLSECQGLLSTAQKTADPEAIELDNTFSTGNCWGAFLSIQQLLTIKLAGARNPMFNACLPEDTTLVQIIQTFDAHARKHPERLSEPFTIVAAGALQDSFHCPK